jgi:hypothetical protein
MKKLVVLLSLVPLVAFAGASKIENVGAATSEALKKFASEENKTYVDAFNGIKSWVSGNQVKVKVYYNANANTVDYVCEMMDHTGRGDEMMMCSK